MVEKVFFDIPWWVSLSEVGTGQLFLSCPILSCCLALSWRAAGQDINHNLFLCGRTGRDRAGQDLEQDNKNLYSDF
jgi:hypothetical protein